ncbi:unnamed protein product, partial [Clonostachys byssicola]
MVSLPMFLFMDAFGLFRNMYRAIDGYYLIPQYVERSQRNKRSNLIPLTLGPFGSDMADAISGLFHLRELDSGTDVVINDRGNLDFNIVELGRYGEQMLLDSKRIRNEPNKTRQNRAAIALGIHEKWDLMDNLDVLFPALDRIRTRPIDAAHSEYQGIGKLLVGLIFNDVLSPKGADLANEAFRTFPFPPTWRRIPGPKRHLDSYGMQECARIVVILPVLLRCWLKRVHIKEAVAAAMESIATDYFDMDSFSDPAYRFTAVEWTIAAAWAFTRSLLFVSGPYSSDRQREFQQAVYRGRRAVQFLLTACSHATRLKNVGRNPRRPNTRTSQIHELEVLAPSEANFSQVSAINTVARVTNIANSSVAPVSKTDKVKYYEDKKKLPNMHAGLHHAEVAEEYGGCRMVFTLQGEDKHKEYKLDITSTNFQNAAATLIHRQNYRMTVSLGFEGCFADKHPQLHKTFTAIKDKCPDLARNLHPRSREPLEIEEDDISELRIAADANHLAPLALHRLKRPLKNDLTTGFLGIVKPQLLDREHEFIIGLDAAYRNDCAMPGFAASSKCHLQWCHKVAFTNQKDRRFCFSVGDFISVEYGPAHDL